MNINAKYFGDVSYEDSDIIQIGNGLIGFDSYTKYLPLSFHEDNDFMISLQSLEEESLSFILMDPFQLFPEYAPVLTEQDIEELKINSQEDIVFYVICVIRDTTASSTVNLKAPLVINLTNRKAKQVILEQPEYTFRHALTTAAKKEEE